MLTKQLKFDYRVSLFLPIALIKRTVSARAMLDNTKNSVNVTRSGVKSLSVDRNANRLRFNQSR